MHPHKENHAGGHQDHQDPRPQVGLFDDQRRRDHHQEPGDDQILEAHGFHPGPPIEVGGQRQDDGDLGQLRGLKGQRAQGQPAPGAVNHLAPEHHRHQQQDTDDIEGVAQLLQVPVIIGQGQAHHAQPHGQPVELLDVEGGPPRRGCSRRCTD